MGPLKAPPVPEEIVEFEDVSEPAPWKLPTFLLTSEPILTLWPMAEVFNPVLSELVLVGVRAAGAWSFTCGAIVLPREERFPTRELKSALRSFWPRSAAAGLLVPAGVFPGVVLAAPLERRGLPLREPAAPPTVVRAWAALSAA